MTQAIQEQIESLTSRPAAELIALRIGALLDRYLEWLHSHDHAGDWHQRPGDERDKGPVPVVQ